MTETPQRAVHTEDTAQSGSRRRMTAMTEAEWNALGERLYGPNPPNWRFRCPCCGHVARIEDFRAFKDRGATPDSAPTECVGRYLPDAARNLAHTPAKDGSRAPCDYAAYGLFRFGIALARDSGKEIVVFPFADMPLEVSLG